MTGGEAGPMARAAGLIRRVRKALWLVYSLGRSSFRSVFGFGQTFSLVKRVCRRRREGTGGPISGEKKIGTRSRVPVGKP